MSGGGWSASEDRTAPAGDDAKAVSIFRKPERDRAAGLRAVGNHHENDFGTYFAHRQLKTDQQINNGRTTRSSIFEGVRVYFNGAFSVRMDTLHGMVVENGGEVTLWKHDSAGRPTHYCTAGLTPSQIAEVKRMRRRPHVVVEAWVHDCIKQGRRLDEAPFMPDALRRATTGGSVRGGLRAMLGPAAAPAEAGGRPVRAAAGATTGGGLLGPPSDDEEATPSDAAPAVASSPPGRTWVGGAVGETVADPRDGPQPPEARVMPTRRTTESDPTFLAQYYAKSRLHLIGEHKAKMQALVDDTQAVLARRLRADGHGPSLPCCCVLPTEGEIARVQAASRGAGAAAGAAGQGRGRAATAAALGRAAEASDEEEEDDEWGAGAAAAEAGDGGHSDDGEGWSDVEPRERAASPASPRGGAADASSSSSSSWKAEAVPWDGSAAPDAPALRAPTDADAPLELLPSEPSGSGPLPGRVVALVDMDCFFVSVQAAVNPALRGLPVAVAHCPDDEAGPDGAPGAGSRAGEGEVSSCSYEARACGARAGQRVKDARERCAERGLRLIVVPYAFERIEATARVVFELFCRATRRVQAQSIDEAFLDLTGCPDPGRAVADLRARIRALTGCPASAGIARSKLLAKLACSAAKRRSGGNAQMVLPDDDAAVDAFLLTLRAYDLPGVGYRGMRQLRARGAETVEDVRRAGPGALRAALGASAGRRAFEAAWGHDPSEEAVGVTRPRKSVGLQVFWGCRFSEDARAEAFIAGPMCLEVSRRMAEAGAHEAGLAELSAGNTGGGGGAAPPRPSDVGAGHPVSVLGGRLTLTVLQAHPRAGLPYKSNGCGRCYNHTLSERLGLATCDAASLGSAAVRLYRKARVVVTELRGLGVQVTELTGPGGAAVRGSEGRGEGRGTMLAFLGGGRPRKRPRGVAAAALHPGKRSRDVPGTGHDRPVAPARQPSLLDELVEPGLAVVEAATAANGTAEAVPAGAAEAGEGALVLDDGAGRAAEAADWDDACMDDVFGSQPAAQASEAGREGGATAAAGRPGRDDCGPVSSGGHGALRSEEDGHDDGDGGSSIAGSGDDPSDGGSSIVDLCNTTEEADPPGPQASQLGANPLSWSQVDQAVLSEMPAELRDEGSALGTMHAEAMLPMAEPRSELQSRFRRWVEAHPRAGEGPARVLALLSCQLAASGREGDAIAVLASCALQGRSQWHGDGPSPWRGAVAYAFERLADAVEEARGVRIHPGPLDRLLRA